VKRFIEAFLRGAGFIGPSSMFFLEKFEKTFRISLDLVGIFLFTADGFKKSARKYPKVKACKSACVGWVHFIYENTGRKAKKIN